MAAWKSSRAEHLQRPRANTTGPHLPDTGSDLAPGGQGPSIGRLAGWVGSSQVTRHLHSPKIQSPVRVNGHKRQPPRESQTGQTTGHAALKDPPHLHRDTHFSADAPRAGLSMEGGFLEEAQRAPENTEGGMGQG